METDPFDESNNDLFFNTTLSEFRSKGGEHLSPDEHEPGPNPNPNPTKQINSLPNYGSRVICAVVAADRFSSQDSLLSLRNF